MVANVTLTQGNGAGAGVNRIDASTDSHRNTYRVDGSRLGRMHRKGALLFPRLTSGPTTDSPIIGPRAEHIREDTQAQAFRDKQAAVQQGQSRNTCNEANEVQSSASTGNSLNPSAIDAPVPIICAVLTSEPEELEAAPAFQE